MARRGRRGRVVRAGGGRGRGSGRRREDREVLWRALGDPGVRAQVREELLEPQPWEMLRALVEYVGDLVEGDETHERPELDRAIVRTVDGLEFRSILGLDHLGEARPQRGL